MSPQKVNSAAHQQMPLYESAMLRTATIIRGERHENLVSSYGAPIVEID